MSKKLTSRKTKDAKPPCLERACSPLSPFNGTPVAVDRIVRRFRSAASGLWYEKPAAAGSINAAELDGKILEREENEHTMAWIRRVSAWAHEIHSANTELRNAVENQSTPESNG